MSLILVVEYNLHLVTIWLVKNLYLSWRTMTKSIWRKILVLLLSPPTCLHWPPSGQVQGIFCDGKVLQRPCPGCAGRADTLPCSDKTCNDEPSWPGDTWQTGQAPLILSASVQSYTLSEIVFSCQKINCCSNKQQAWAESVPDGSGAGPVLTLVYRFLKT